jgi:hypothetical protein
MLYSKYWTIILLVIFPLLCFSMESEKQKNKDPTELQEEVIKYQNHLRLKEVNENLIKKLKKIQKNNLYLNSDVNNFVKQNIQARKIFFNKSNGFLDLQADIHNDSLLPIINRWEKYFLEHDDEAAKFFLNEIKFFKKNDSICWDYLTLLAPRYLLSGSILSKKEKLLFKSVISQPGQKTIDELAKPKNDLWRNPIAFARAWKNLIPNKEMVVEFKPNTKLEEFIDKKIDALLPPPIQICIPKTSYFTICDLILNYLNNCHLLGTPSLMSCFSAHGVKDLSPFGFCLHDKIHGDLDNNKLVAFKIFIHSKMIEHATINPKSGLDDKFIYSVVNSYFITIELLKFILLKSAIEAIETEKPPISLLGFFIAIHELPVWNSDVFFWEYGPKSFINNFLLGVNHAFNNPKIWINSEDPLQTCPIDGNTNLSDKDIIKKLGIDLKKITSFEIKRTKMFIIIKLIDKNKENVIWYPTLFHKFRNAIDTVSLLNFGGIEKKPPTNPSYVQAILFIDEVRAEMIKAVEIFRMSAERHLAELVVFSNGK